MSSHLNNDIPLITRSNMINKKARRQTALVGYSKCNCDSSQGEPELAFCLFCCPISMFFCMQGACRQADGQEKKSENQHMNTRASRRSTSICECFWSMLYCKNSFCPRELCSFARRQYLTHTLAMRTSCQHIQAIVGPHAHRLVDQQPPT